MLVPYQRTPEFTWLEAFLTEGNGVLIKTRDADRFYRLLNHLDLNGIDIEGVTPADDNVNSVYDYLIGDEETVSP